jgi:hypothetical protein
MIRGPTVTRKRQARNDKRHRTGRADASPPFRVVVAAHPGPGLSIGPELELVKAALLYGDRVTLLSPVLTAFLRFEGLEHLRRLRSFG